MFYLADYTHKTRAGVEITDKEVLHFKFGEFDGHATVKHITEHPRAYQKFLKANPDYQSPWKEINEKHQVKPLEETVILDDKEKAKPVKSKKSAEETEQLEDQGEEAAGESEEATTESTEKPAPAAKPKKGKTAKAK